MHLWRRICFSPAFLTALFLFGFFASPSADATTGHIRKALTVERIYSIAEPECGRLTRGLTWTPDGKQLSYFETKGAGKEAKTELWTMDAASGERRLLVAADKLESILPADSSKPTQATVSAAALRRSISGRRMARAFCFKAQRRWRGWI